MRASAILLLGGVAAICACTSKEKGGNTETKPGETGLELKIGVADLPEEVAGIQYRIDRVACADGETFEALRRDAQVELQAANLPGGIPGMQNGPLDGSAKHAFADRFEVLPAGCYDVIARPVLSDGTESSECGAARANRVEVLDGMTTEVFLLSQCRGPNIGAIDAVAAFNRPPQIEGLTFTPSKIIEAGGSTTVCVSASDPNGDPMEVEWDQVGAAAGGGGMLSGQPAAAGGASAGGELTECAEISPEEAGDYLFEVRVYDVLRDENNRALRFEQWYSEHGSPNVSNDSLRFPVYAMQASEEVAEE
ncbi:MAG: hypothetical protein R3B70_28045 [Polyangiaceae bacterium]